MGKIIDALKELIKEFIQPNNEGGSFEELALSSGLNEKDIQLLKDTMNGNEKDLAEKKPVSKITEENKDELHLLHFPNIKITFDELFEEIDY